MDIAWPFAWQSEAREALQPYVGSDSRVEVVVGNPNTSVDGSVMAGFVYREGLELWMIHDRSGRSDAHPWRMLAGPVLRIYLLDPRRRLLYAHPEWAPKPR